MICKRVSRLSCVCTSDKWVRYGFDDIGMVGLPKNRGETSV